MNNIFRIASCIACICFSCSLIISCSDDPVLIKEEAVSDVKGVYISVKIRTNVAGNFKTRGEAVETETGSEKENAISCVRIILAEKDDNSYKTITYSDVLNPAQIIQEEDENSKILCATGAFNYDDLKEYLSDSSDGKDIYVFVIANYGNNSSLHSPLKGYDVQSSISFDNNEMKNAGIGNVPVSAGNQEMTNESIYSAKLTLSELERANTIDNAAKLRNGNEDIVINLQRTAARIDIDLSKLKFVYSGESYSLAGNNSTGTKETDVSIYTLTIDGLALANMSRDYFLFQETGDGNNSWNFLGSETENLFIRDPKISNKLNSNTIFYQSLYDIRPESGKKISVNFSFVPVEDLSHTESVYAPLHYALPNSIYPNNNQLKKNCTAVVYRAKIESDLVSQADGADLIAYGDKLMGSFDSFSSNEDENIKNLFNSFMDSYKSDVAQRKQDLEYAIIDLEAQKNEVSDENKKNDLENQITERKSLLEKIKTEANRLGISDDEQKDTQNLDLEESKFSAPEDEYLYELFKQSLIKKNFSIYTSQGDNYYCYYFYWIRHNDNGNEIESGDMEFAIVRNYVYKLSLKGIDSLGYPDYLSNDPTPFNIEKKIESADAFLDVQTTVLPWGLIVDDEIIIK